MNFMKLISIFSSLLVVFKCYAESASLRIVGGQDATPEQLQSIVRIEIKMNDISEYICSGSVLSSTWVLTAAHCCDEAPAYNNHTMVIRYKTGFEIPFINDSFSEVVEVKIHPFFISLDKRNTWISKNDIALLKTTPMKLDRYRKISAIDYTVMFGQETIAAGYGITKDSHTNVYDTSSALNKTLQVEKFLASKCSLDETILLVHPSICLSPRCNERVALCGGDSGGPLLYSSKIVGVLILSSQIRCGPYVKVNAEDVDFGVAIPVSPYIQWIRNTIKL
ncbi:unnamed protein product [Diatraea saccharalis]|uniref:Peptidase S1 domain-containing protein n=1 Tax=Diatraea saccharalis TaxID=40085 RepID=A0A9N9WIZ7_9NEOP|nr:unnamed protein product [Diatraea saccharalis]